MASAILSDNKAPECNQLGFMTTEAGIFIFPRARDGSISLDYASVHPKLKCMKAQIPCVLCTSLYVRMNGKTTALCDPCYVWNENMIQA